MLMRELIEVYEIIDKNLTKTTNFKKIEEILDYNESYKNLTEVDKEHIINYINKQIEMIKENKNFNEIKRNMNNKNNNNNDKSKKLKYKIVDDENKQNEGEELSSQTTAIMLKKMTKEEYERLKDIFVALSMIILPEQRTPEWFEMRNGKMTASDAGCAAGENKHEHKYKFVHKKVYGSTFKTNVACYHGKKLEEPVTLMYEYQNDVKVKEFGLLGHEVHTFLGASPDGICSPYKRNGKTKTDLVGRMLEIKCPLTRKIKYKGEIKDNICPIYYWDQVQNQLACCDLEECDFVQCNMEEYASKEEWDEDTNEECYYKSKKYGKERGVLVEFLPVDLFIDKEKEKAKAKENKICPDDSDDEDEDEDDEDDEQKYGEGYDENGKVKLSRIYDMATFKYQPKIDMTQKQIEAWVKATTKGYKNIYDIKKEQDNGTFNKDKEKNVAIHKVIYWRLKERNCTLIKRDREWFENMLPKFQQIWDYVIFLRNNKEKRKKWKEIVKQKEKIFQQRQFNNYYIKTLDKTKLGDELYQDMINIINE